ncbi:MAG: NUDIX domain-containing protein [Candidatus Pacebacteria bacterium]|nr:NUDIX domain-containing protein [Candidatus Paceibacterota bacterium]
MEKRIRAVAVILNGDNIALLHQIKNGKEYYVFPGGGVEVGESVEEAVLREAIEETSLTVKIEKFLYHYSYDDNTENIFYLCRYVSGILKLGEANEAEGMRRNRQNFYEPVWIPIKELSKTLVYPLEARDWFLEDIANNFENARHEIRLKKSELRLSF